MDPRWRTISILTGGAIAFELVEPVERHVEPVAAFVLDDGHLQRGFARGDRLDSAVDADSVLEVHDVVAQRQSTGGSRRRGLAVPARPAQAARPAEDLVVGEHPERGHDEAALESPDGERGTVAPSGTLSGIQRRFEQLLQALELPLVVAKNQGRQAGPQQRAQAVEIPVDALGREEPELQVHLLVPQHEAGKLLEPLAPLAGRLEDAFPAGHVLTQPPGHLEMVRGLVPGPGDLVEVGPGGFLDQQRVGGEELEEGLADGRTGGRADVHLVSHRQCIDRQHSDVGQLLERSLRGQIETAERGDLVAPPLQPGGCRHTEAVQIQDSAAYTELGDLTHGRYPLVPHGLERAGDLGGRAAVADG